MTLKGLMEIYIDLQNVVATMKYAIFDLKASGFLEIIRALLS